MTFRRILTPVVLILALAVVQFAPGTGFTPRVQAAVYSSCDAAQFIADVTVPDGTSFAPGAAFTKTWRLTNVGTCTWTTAYSLVFISGDLMGAPTTLNLSSSVAPGGSVDLSVSMIAPTAAGHYRGYWKLKDPGGVVFGVGPAGHPEYNWVFFVDIYVGSTYTVAYDFVTNYCSASWTSGAGALPCPGTSGSPNGSVQQVATPQLENGSYDTNPGLLVSPQTVAGGFIKATYPAFTVQAGDRFQSIVNCAYNASSCYVTFQLGYQIGGGPVRTFWSWHERFEGLYYRVNLDLSSLAGQSVNFVLYVADVAGRGVPSGDSAMWSGARIVRGGGATGPVTTPPPSSACNRGWFIADVTIPDGTVLAAGGTFTKTWRLLNNGSCTWTTNYALVFVSGDLMGGAPAINLTSSVAPGQTVDLSVNLTAPTASGHYRGYWKLRDASGGLFGVGTGGSYTFWVDINVTGSFTTIYDFTANACAASWTSGAGSLPCYGVDGDPRGFVLNVGSPTMEDGSVGAPGLLTVPQNVTDGYIQGIYPAFPVHSGDHFQALVSCQNGNISCDVNFKLDYQIGGGSVQNFSLVHKAYDGTTHHMDIDLSLLAGQNVNFILTIQSNGSSTGARAIWSAPRLARLVVPPPPGPTPTVGPGADLAVTITDPDTSYTPGGSTTYTVVVRNNGPLAVTGATFTDMQPPQSTGMTVTCVADPGALCTASGSVGPGVNVTDTVNIPAGKKVTYTILSFASGLATGIMSNTVNIAPPVGVPDPIPTNNSATYNLTPPYADLAVTMTNGASLYTPGGTITYTVVVFNYGPLDVTGAPFIDPLPTQGTGWNVSCVFDPGALCAGGAPAGDFSDIINIPAGKKVTYTMVLTVNVAATGPLLNTASVTVPTGITDPIPANNTASLTHLPPSADLMVTITDNTNSYVPGGTLTYTVVVTNNGPSDVVNGTFTDNQPLLVLSWTVVCTPDLGAACSPLVTPGVSITDGAVVIPAGKKVTYTIVATLKNPATGPLANQVFVANPLGLSDPVPGNNTATDTDY